MKTKNKKNREQGQLYWTHMIMKTKKIVMGFLRVLAGIVICLVGSGMLIFGYCANPGILTEFQRIVIAVPGLVIAFVGAAMITSLLPSRPREAEPPDFPRKTPPRPGIDWRNISTDWVSLSQFFCMKKSAFADFFYVMLRRTIWWSCRWYRISTLPRRSSTCSFPYLSLLGQSSGRYASLRDRWTCSLPSRSLPPG